MHHQISEIQIFPVKHINGLVALASIVFDNSIYLQSIGIFTRPSGGYRLVYPTKKTGDRSLNIFHPINRETADLIEAAVIGKFTKIAHHIDQQE